jgi:hypothetical protein
VRRDFRNYSGKIKRYAKDQVCPRPYGEAAEFSVVTPRSKGDLTENASPGRANAALPVPLSYSVAYFAGPASERRVNPALIRIDRDRFRPRQPQFMPAAGRGR